MYYLINVATFQVLCGPFHRAEEASFARLREEKRYAGETSKDLMIVKSIDEDDLD